MPILPDPIAVGGRLPDATDVLVIGGGIVGACAALTLAERGIAVTLCEKGRIAGEQSGRNWGWVRKQGRDPRELPLMLDSMRQWQGLDARLGAETGFLRSGIFYLCREEADLDRYEAWLEKARIYQLDSRLLGRSELARLLPASDRTWAGALYTASDGRAEPQKAAPAIALAARRAGAVVLTDCAVRGLETAAGRIEAALTERGRIRCSAVVLAGGVWSGLFCRRMGLSLPQLTVRASVLRTAPLAGPEGAVKAPGFAFRKRLDGGYTIGHPNRQQHVIVPDSFRFLPRFLSRLLEERRDIQLAFSPRRFREAALGARYWGLDSVSPFERCRVLNPEPSSRDLDQALQNLGLAFPVFRQAKPVERWAGMIDGTPDALPVISPVSDVPGLTVATGFSGHGFGIGPGAGRLAADLATGARPAVDPAPFAWSRFQR